MKFHVPLGVPVACSLVSFVLAMLVLLAGKNPGFMENYHIVMFNTSTLGRHLAPASTGGPGIREFYSLHVTDVCEGDFSPNATAGFNVTRCTGLLKAGNFNVTALLERELSVGPLGVSVADLGLSKDMRAQLDKLPRLLVATAALYIVAAVLAALAMLACLAAPVLLVRRPVAAAAATLAVSVLATVALLAGNLIAAAGARPAARKIDEIGRHIGLRVTAGDKFAALAWAALGLMATAAVCWGYRLWQVKKGMPGVREKYNRPEPKRGRPRQRQTHRQQQQQRQRQRQRQRRR